MGNLDIPRLYTVLAEWLSCFMLAQLLRPRIGKGKFYGISAIYLVILTIFMELTADTPLYIWIPCMILAFLSMAAFISICIKINFVESIFYAVLAFSLAECIASLEWQIVNYLYSDINAMPLYVELPILMLVYGSIVFGAWKMLQMYIPTDRRLKIERKDGITSVFICVIIFGFSNLSFLSENMGIKGYTKEIGNIRTLVDVAGVCMLYAHFLTCCGNMVRDELLAVQNTLSSQYKQYKQSRESVDIINMKYHDLKHQINLLREMNDHEQRTALLDRMEADIKAYELQNKTGNAVLDTLLTSKSLYCDKHGITMTVVADGSLLDFMDTLDICSIFGNALDNAIESVLQTQDKEKRLIHLSVSRVKSFIMIRIENYFEEQIDFDEESCPVTKKDKTIHGYGIKSIKYTANRYDGVVNISAQNNWFELKILIPYNTNTN